MLTQFHVSKLLKLSKSSRFLYSFVAFMFISPVLLAEKTRQQVAGHSQEVPQFSQKETSKKYARAQSAEKMKPKKIVCPPWPY